MEHPQRDTTAKQRAEGGGGGGREKGDDRGKTAGEGGGGAGGGEGGASQRRWLGGVSRQMMCNRLVELALLPEPLNSGATAGGEEDENRGGGGGGGQDGGGGESTLYFGTGPGLGGGGGLKEVCRLGAYPRVVVLAFVLQQTMLGAVTMSKGRVRHVTLVIAQCIPQTRKQVC